VSIDPLPESSVFAILPPNPRKGEAGGIFPMAFGVLR